MTNITKGVLLQTRVEKLPATSDFLQDDHTPSPGLIAAAVTLLIILLIMTALLVCYAIQRFRKIIEAEDKSKSASYIHLPHHVKAFSNPVKFTIPTTPQMPHEMPRSYIHHIRATASFEKKSGNGHASGIKNNRGKIGQQQRAPRLSVVGRSQSAKPPVTGTEKATQMFSLRRSKSVPSKLSRPKGPIGSTIGSLNPDLYPEENMEEYQPSKYGFGKLSFSLSYDKDLGVLTVNLIQAAQLPGSTCQQKANDTFVKIYLLPDVDNKHMATSKIFRRSVNPRYNQTFVFRVVESDFPDTLIRFVVFQYDRYSHPQVIGKAEYELGPHEFDVLGTNDTIWRDLVEHPWENELPLLETKRGEILFSLNYLPNAERLNISILKAKNLRTSSATTVVPHYGTDVTGYDRQPTCQVPASSEKTGLGIYIKISIVKGGKQIKSKQTNPVRKDLNPIFNESFSLELKADELDMTCIVVAVCLRVNQLKCHRILGRCVIGGDIICSGKEAAHWNEMLANPRSAVAFWHALK